MHRFASSRLATFGLVIPLALGFSALAASTLAGCSSSDSGSACSAYAPPVGTDLTTPAVHFKADVVPVFVLSCAFSACHGEQNGTNQGVYLGSKDAATLDTDRIYKATLNVASVAAPSMSLVTPGDTANSFLLHKIDGDLCAIKVKCTGGDCGTNMPQGGDLIEVSQRDIIRRWIAQGAKND